QRCARASVATKSLSALCCDGTKLHFKIPLPSCKRRNRASFERFRDKHCSTE
ncbi:hypothetical protein HDU84_009211, partial [Entophlyctis sp. JEL0112]